jgi:hypothetical protein
VGRIHEPPNLVSDLGRQHPPAFFPGTDAAHRPGVGVLAECVVHILIRAPSSTFPKHVDERARVQVVEQVPARVVRQCGES